jgi:serine acetyltransferase
VIGLSAIAGNGSEPEPVSLHQVRKGHPRFLEALVADARVAAAYRGERFQFDSKLDGVLTGVRLMLMADAFLALAAYRLNARFQAMGVPLLPHVLKRIASWSGGVAIGDPVVVEPGVYLPHGQVVIDGFVRIREGTMISPWVTIGLIGASYKGPDIGPHARVGTGVKVLGEVRVGKGARIAANSVVLSDVPDDATAVGNPAKPAAD